MDWQLVVRLLRVPWTARRANQSKEIGLEKLLKRLMLKLQSFGYLMPAHWKRPWYWERLRAGGEGGNREWDGCMASPTQWTWVWANSGRQRRTGKPGVLQFMGLQRVRHDLATEQNNYYSLCSHHLETKKAYKCPLNIPVGFWRKFACHSSESISSVSWPLCLDTWHSILLGIN